MTDLIVLGYNPGMRYVKNSLYTPGSTKRRDLKPFPATIAPQQKRDESGLARANRDLTATVDGRHFVGGEVAERLPMAIRQQTRDRLDPQSVLYSALAQMSAQHAGYKQNGTKPTIVVGTALPVSWRLDNDQANALMQAHVRSGLSSYFSVRHVYVQSEPNSVVASLLLDDNGDIRPDRGDLAKLVCIGDVGGGTLGRSVLEALSGLPGQSASPDTLGSSQVVHDVMQAAGMRYLDAERRIEQAVTNPGKDDLADQLLAQYRDAVVTEFQEAWKAYHPALKIFAGGTIHWVRDQVLKAFPNATIHEQPQQAVAIGLARYAMRKARGL